MLSIQESGLFKACTVCAAIAIVFTYTNSINGGVYNSCTNAKMGRMFGKYILTQIDLAYIGSTSFM